MQPVSSKPRAKKIFIMEGSEVRFPETLDKISITEKVLKVLRTICFLENVPEEELTEATSCS